MAGYTIYNDYGKEIKRIKITDDFFIDYDPPTSISPNYHFLTRNNATGRVEKLAITTLFTNIYNADGELEDDRHVELADKTLSFDYAGDPIVAFNRFGVGISTTNTLDDAIIPRIVITDGDVASIQFWDSKIWLENVDAYVSGGADVLARNQTTGFIETISSSAFAQDLQSVTDVGNMTTNSAMFGSAIDLSSYGGNWSSGASTLGALGETNGIAIIGVGQGNSSGTGIYGIGKYGVVGDNHDTGWGVFGYSWNGTGVFGGSDTGIAGFFSSGGGVGLKVSNYNGINTANLAEFWHNSNGGLLSYITSAGRLTAKDFTATSMSSGATSTDIVVSVGGNLRTRTFSSLLSASSVPTGSGTLNYLARWSPDGNTLTVGAATDDGTTVRATGGLFEVTGTASTAKAIQLATYAGTTGAHYIGDDGGGFFGNGLNIASSGSNSQVFIQPVSIGRNVNVGTNAALGSKLGVKGDTGMSPIFSAYNSANVLVFQAGQSASGIGYGVGIGGAFDFNYALKVTGQSWFTDNVGIGVAPNASYILGMSAAMAWTNLTSSTGTNRTLYLANNTSGTSVFGIEGSAAGSAFTGTSAYATLVGNTGAYSLQFATNNTVRATIDSSGNVGIGVVPVTGNNLSVGGTSTVQQRWLSSAANATPIYIGTNSGNNLYIALNRDVVGTVHNTAYTIPAILLNNGTNTSSISFYLSNTPNTVTETGRAFGTGNWFFGASPTDAGYKVDINGTLRNVNGAYFATTSGNVGIGTTNAVTGLDILHGGVAVTNAGNVTVRIVDSTSVAQDVGGSIVFGGRYNSGGSDIAGFAIIKGGKQNSTLGSIAGYLSFFTRLEGDFIENGRFTGAGTFQTTRSITASSAIARGVYVNNTLVAAANNDVLVGLDISNTFTVGAFTGVARLSLRTAGYIQTNAGLAIGGSLYSTSTGFPVNGFQLTSDGTNGTFNMGSGSGFAYKFFTNATERLRINDSNVMVLNTNMLVGTTTDAGYKLDVAGTGRFTSDLYANTRISLGGSSLLTWGSGWFSAQGVSGINSLVLSNHQAVGSHLTTNGYYNGTAWKYVTVGGASNIYLGDGTVTGAMVFRVAASGVGGNDITWINALVLASTGAATFASTVSATSLTATGLTAGGIPYIGTGGLLSYTSKLQWVEDSANPYIKTVAGTNSNAILMYDEVGTTNYLGMFKRPSSVGGNMSLPAGSAEILFNGATTSALGIYTYSASYLALGTGNTEAMRIHQTTRNILIGTTTDGGQKLQVNGTFFNSGTANIVGATSFGISGFSADGKNYWYNDNVATPFTYQNQYVMLNNGGSTPTLNNLYQVNNSSGSHGAVQLTFKLQGVNATPSLIDGGYIRAVFTDAGTGSMSLGFANRTNNTTSERMTLVGATLTVGSTGDGILPSVMLNYQSAGQTSEATFGSVRTGNSGWQGQNTALKAGAANSGGNNLNGGAARIYGGIATGSGSSNVEVFTYGGGTSGTTDGTAYQLATFKGSDKSFNIHASGYDFSLMPITSPVNGIRLGHNSGSRWLTFGVNSANNLVISNTGNVIVNSTTDHGEKFQVEGTSYFNGTVQATGIVYATYSAGVPGSGSYASAPVIAQVSSAQWLSGNRPGIGFWGVSNQGSFMYMDGTGNTFRAINAGGTVTSFAMLEAAQTWTATQTFAAISATSVTATGLTVGRMPLVGTGGLITDSANILYNITTGTQFNLLARVAGEFSTATLYDEATGGYLAFVKRGTTAVGNLSLPAGSAEINFNAASGTGLGIFTSSSSYLMFGTNSAERARFHQTTGNFLLGTTSDAGYKLDVNGTARFVNNVTFGGTQNSFSTANSYLFFPNSGGIRISPTNAINTASTTVSALTVMDSGYGAIAWTTGTNVFNAITINTQINTTGGTTTARGFYYNPTLTGVVGLTHYAFESTSGLVQFVDGSNALYFNSGNQFIVDMVTGHILQVGGNNKLQVSATVVSIQDSYLLLAASTTARPSMNMPAGIAPTTPTNGDIWQDGTNVYIRIGGITKTFTIV